MLVFIPLIHSSRPRFQGGTTMAEENTTLVSQDFESNLLKSSANFSTHIVEESARAVPTGPDPLHHNENPAGP
ncbi:CLAVATA3/ESR (CLE)-related 40-like protein [Melia azedarach]|uniref:CLAVATA3/ESR (CLE)-related 40-like protein n=1 Tax=Melia azedarach TaxID=155640 RepID=A0ACC1YLC1_MELAZ|nr:CLAVATA3/ESR (CLE)-related 40-like protein [Melia azedarach]